MTTSLLYSSSNLKAFIIVLHYFIFYNKSIDSKMSSTVQRNVTLSALTANNKRVYSRLAVWLITNVGFSIQERKTMPSQELHRESLLGFNNLLDTCDVVVLCQEHFRTDVPLPEDVADVKFLVKEFYNTAVDKVSYNLLLLL